MKVTKRAMQKAYSVGSVERGYCTKWYRTGDKEAEMACEEYSNE